MNLIVFGLVKSMIVADDFLKLLSVKYFAVLKSLYCIILCQCHHPPFYILSFMYITFSTHQFKQVWGWDVDQTLYLPSRNIKSAEAFCPGPRWGSSQRPPDPIAGFKPILCLVLFFVGPNCMRISLSPHF